MILTSQSVKQAAESFIVSTEYKKFYTEYPQNINTTYFYYIFVFQFSIDVIMFHSKI